MTREELARRAAAPGADLAALAAEAGVSPATARRLGAAWRVQGVAGVEALSPSGPVPPTLSAFHARCIGAWLDREVGPGRLEVRSRGCRHTLHGDGEPLYQLRFVPGRCRWLLLARRGRSWWPLVPSRPCLSLTDWLGQVRRRETRPGSGTGPDPPGGPRTPVRLSGPRPQKTGL